MKVAVIGASGNVGKRIVAELLSRGHQVTGIARNPGSIEVTSGLVAVAGDATEPSALAKTLAGHDAVVSAVRFKDGNPANLIDAVRASGVRRYFVVGGAASLEVAPGVRHFDTPHFPAVYKAEAAAGIVFLHALKGVDDLDWTFLSPAAAIGPASARPSSS